MDLIWGGGNKEVCLQNGNRKIMVFNVLKGNRKEQAVLLHDPNVNMLKAS